MVNSQWNVKQKTVCSRLFKFQIEHTSMENYYYIPNIQITCITTFRYYRIKWQILLSNANDSQRITQCLINFIVHDYKCHQKCVSTYILSLNKLYHVFQGAKKLKRYEC